MKIAMIFDGLGFGGIERVGLDYINILRDNGHNVDVYNLRPSKNDFEMELPERTNIYHYNFNQKLCPELYAYGVKKWWWGKFAYPFLHVILSIILILKRFRFKFTNRKKYDIVIAFSGHINDLTFVAKNFLISSKKLCWLHSSLADYLLVSDGFGILYKQIKNLITVSTHMQLIALNNNKFLNDLNINLLYNPTNIGKRLIDEEVVKELKEKYGDYILMVGRMTKQKDQETVLKAAKILKEKYNNNNKILFVGDGENRISLEENAKQLKVDDRCIFVGSRLDVQNYYKAAKLFVHSSPAEGCPLVLIEAMGFGVPIVATKSLPGVAEILLDNEYGLVCPVGDAEGLASNIYKLLTDSSLYNFYVNQGFKRIKDFCPEVISNQLNDILKKLK